MLSGLVVEHQVACQAPLGSADGLVGTDLHILVFNASSADLRTRCHRSTLPVHANLDALVFQEAGDPGW